jgi:hypothetical protein
MTTHLAAAAVAAASNVPALIAVGGVALGAVLAMLSTMWQQARASRSSGNSAARQQVEAVTVELIAAVMDLQRALQMVERWSSPRTRSLVVGMATMEVLVGKAGGEGAQGMMRAVRGARDWSERAEEAIVVELSAPTARVMTVLARAVLLADHDIVAAAGKVIEVLPVVTAAYTDAPLIPARRKAARQAARDAADIALENALTDLVVVVREQLHPTPPVRWWHRAGHRRLETGTRTPVVLTASPSTTGAVSPALPATPTP